MRRIRFSSLRWTALAAAALMIALAAMPASGFAHFEPGGFQALRWFWTNQPAGTRHTLRVLYDRDCVGDWQTVDSAASAWQATPTPLIFTAVGAPDCWTNHYSSVRPVGNGWQAGTVTFRNSWVAGASIAYTLRGHCYWKLATDICMGWSVTGYGNGTGWINDGVDTVLIYENHMNYDRYSQNDQRDTLKHELGHALGLEHAGYYASESMGGRAFPDGIYSVMDYCCPSQAGLVTPTTHDIIDVNMEYPGW